MYSSLCEFTDRLNQLHRSLEETELVDQLSALEIGGSSDVPFVELRPALRRLLDGKTDRHVYTYASCMVLLYGLYEQFVESLLMAYVDALGNLVPTYANLPTALKDTHDQLSARLILNLGYEKYRNRTTALEVARRLASCTGGLPYELNSLAYIDHNANLKIGVVNALFKDVGLAGFSKKVVCTQALSAYLSFKYPGGVERLPDEAVFEDLATLVDRRNTIAHSWPDDILGIPYMKELADYVRQLGEAFHEVCALSVSEFSVRYRAVALPAPIAVYGNSIICFRIEDMALSRGMRIAARNGQGRLLEGEILELQVDHLPVERVEAPPAVNVACRVGFRAKKTYGYFLLMV